MRLRSQILKAHTKANCDIIVNWVGDSPARFDELFDLFLCDEYRVVQRAGWPLSYCVIKHPELIKKHFAKLVKNVQKPGTHPAVKRNTIRLLQDIDIPKKYQGEIMDLCFQAIADPKEAIAIKAFALTVLHRFCRQYPEIKNELKVIIEQQWNQATAAFRSRAKKILEDIK